MIEVDNKLKTIVEGLLLASGKPLSLESLADVFGEDERPQKEELNLVLESISDDCKNRGFELKQVASGYRFQVKQELGEWVARLWDERPPRYTRALLETLSLIAYRQPITRGEIEEVRGVGVSSNIIRTLQDREWVRVVGHRDVPGKPAMFATTKQFLDYFNLKSLQELPPLSEIKDLGELNRELDLDGDDLIPEQRLLEIPEELSDEKVLETEPDSEEELLAEAEAIALAKKPLDEILNLGMETPDEADLEPDLDPDVNPDSEVEADNL